MKQFVTYFFILLGIISLSASQKKAVKCDFVLISAQKQTSYGGVAGSPVVTRYVVKIKPLRSFKFVADSAYAEEKIDKFTVQKKDFSTVDSLYINKGKVITIVFDITTATDFGSLDFPSKFESSPTRKTPVTSATGIVIRYKGGKHRYFDINKVTEMPAVYAP
ncbi:MAG: hypothetical protein V4613_01345 [Bacteroidota bacterium]